MPLLASLGLLPLLSSVLHGWVVRLQAERRHFGGADSAGGSPAAQLEQAGAQAAQQQPKGGQQQAQQLRAAAAARGPAPHDAGGTGPRAVDGAAAAELEYDAESGGAVAAEISEPAAMEALALLEALAADVAGEAALNASGEAPPGGGACCERLGPGAAIWWHLAVWVAHPGLRLSPGRLACCRRAEPCCLRMRPAADSNPPSCDL